MALRNVGIRPEGIHTLQKTLRRAEKVLKWEVYHTFLYKIHGVVQEITNEGECTMRTYQVGEVNREVLRNRKFIKQRKQGYLMLCAESVLPVSNRNSTSSWPSACSTTPDAQNDRLRRQTAVIRRSAPRFTCTNFRVPTGDCRASTLSTVTDVKRLPTALRRLPCNECTLTCTEFRATN